MNIDTFRLCDRQHNMDIGTMQPTPSVLGSVCVDEIVIS